MARRRKKDELAPIQAIVLVLMLGAFFGVYKLTNSFTTAGLAAGCILGVFIAISLVIFKNKQEQLRKSGIHEIDKMDGRQFELYLGHLFSDYGYKTEVTQSQGDYGADLVVSKEGKKIVIQAKRYKGNVGLKAVQEIFTAKNHYGATEAWVVTNSEYTQQAYNLAKSNGVKLINRKQLIDMILNKDKGSKVDTTKQEVNNNVSGIIKEDEIIDSNTTHLDDECPKCGYLLVKRKVAKGEAYVCSNYPKCNHRLYT